MPSASQRAMFGALPSRIARCSTGQREPVDLEEEDARDVGLHALARAPGDALDDAQRVGVVVVRAEEDLEDDVTAAATSAAQERRPEGVDLDRVVGQLGDDA